LVLIEMSSVPKIESTSSDPRLTVARNPSWEDRVKEIDAAQNRLKQVNRRSETHQVTHTMITI